MPALQSRDADGLYNWHLSFLSIWKHFGRNTALSIMSTIDSAKYRIPIYLVERSPGSHVFTLHESRRLLLFSNSQPQISRICLYCFLFRRLAGYTGTGCTTAAAWLTSGDHLRTGHGHAPDSYLILSLKIDKGFRAGRGTVSFTFQLDCEGDCQFVFMQVT